jgi:hypothetical protein
LVKTPQQMFTQLTTVRYPPRMLPHRYHMHSRKWLSQWTSCGARQHHLLEFLHYSAFVHKSLWCTGLALINCLVDINITG